MFREIKNGGANKSKLPSIYPKGTPDKTCSPPHGPSSAHTGIATLLHQIRTPGLKTEWNHLQPSTHLLPKSTIVDLIIHA
jgi:hypothetical protein